MRRALKFLHTLGAIGLMGSMACLVAVLSMGPPETASAYAQTSAEMARIGKWVFFPSLALTLMAGLLSIGFVRAFHNAGWAWAKAATGLVVFEAGLVNIQGPIQAEADRAAAALSEPFDAAAVAGFVSMERNTLLLMLAVALANVALGVWRPRFGRAQGGAAPAPSQE